MILRVLRDIIAEEEREQQWLPILEIEEQMTRQELMQLREACEKLGKQLEEMKTTLEQEIIRMSKPVNTGYSPIDPDD